MKRVTRLISIFALAAIVVAPVFYLAGRIELDPVKTILFVATIAWFVATPLWLKQAGK